MIQRIQTVFLVLSAIAIGAMAFFPIANFTNAPGVKGATSYYIFTIFEISDGAGGSPFGFWFTLPLLVIPAAIAVLSIVAVFLYKNRAEQIRLTQTGIFLNILLVVGIMFFYIERIETITQSTASYEYVGIYLPLISLVFLVLAHRFIRRDEKLVRSLDRLR